MDKSLATIALTTAYFVNRQCAGDPRQPYVVLMAAAAIAGHIIKQEPGSMHETLDQVMDAARIIVSEVAKLQENKP